MRSLARAIIRRRRWVLAAWLIVFAALVPLAGRLEQELEVAAQVGGSEAAGVERTLATRFASPFARHAVLVASGVPAPGTPAGNEVLRAVVTAVERVPGVTGTLSYLNVADTVFLGARALGTYLLVGLDPAGSRPDALVPPLRAATERLSATLRQAYPQAALRWTGEIPINFDLRRTSAEESARAEQRVLPLTLVLLLLAFNAVVAALLPLVAATLAIAITLGAAVLINTAWPLSILLQSIVSMIGFGVGIDYALLTVSRFREALAAGLDAESAAAEAAEHAGGTIALSGAAVMIGFASLLLVPLNEMQAIGVGGILVVGVSVLMAMTLLPGLLAWLGPRIDAGRILRMRNRSNPFAGWWRAWGRWVIGHSWLVLIVAGAPVVRLAWEAPRLRAELPRGNWLPAQMESARALDDLYRMNRSGVVNTMRVLVELPPGMTVHDSAGWLATRRITGIIAGDPRVSRVQSLTTILPLEAPNRALYATLPAAIRQSIVTGDGRATVVEILPHESAEFNDLTTFTRELRRLDAVVVSGVPGARMSVGGMPAFNVDYTDAIDSRIVRVVLLVVISTLLALMFGFRSVLIAVKALALNLLSVAAAFGAVVLVFQDGYGIRWVGLTEPLHGVFPAVPILVFCIVFGLSMDYEVFLVSRVAEARRHMGESDAIVEGLVHTGGVITSAAAIMIAVFAAFTLGDFLFVKVLGFALAVAVFLDATIVRVAIGPALLRLAGKWNWWPGDSLPLRRNALAVPNTADAAAPDKPEPK
jgi:RND superfamily putative drug exporter